MVRWLRRLAVPQTCGVGSILVITRRDEDGAAGGLVDEAVDGGVEDVFV